MKVKQFLPALCLIVLSGCDSIFFPEDTNEMNPHPNFSREFIEENRGTYLIETPEVQELIHIIIAITPAGLADRNMVDHTTVYYQKVMNHFLEFQEESIVNTFNKLVRNDRYAHLKMDACGFYFDDEGSILKNTTYDRLNWGLVNYVEPYVSELEYFAEKTDFRQFYTENKSYYQSQVDLLEVQAPVSKQWNWLEERASIRYDHYWVTFSPLTGGFHSTNRFETSEFKQTAMFISGPIENSQYSDPVTEALMTRVLFTEIDHNYVNPISDRYLDEIRSAMDDLKKWSANDRYPSAYSVFNEYMTWAVFTLYAFDHLSEEDFNFVNERIENQMSISRKFHRYKDFNRKLLELYMQQPITPIESFYPDMLLWCKNQ